MLSTPGNQADTADFQAFTPLHEDENDENAQNPFLSLALLLGGEAAGITLSKRSADVSTVHPINGMKETELTLDNSVQLFLQAIL